MTVLNFIPTGAADQLRIRQTIMPIPNYRLGISIKNLLDHICIIFEAGKDEAGRNRFEFTKTNEELAKDMGSDAKTISREVNKPRNAGLLLVEIRPDEGGRRTLTPAPVLRQAYYAGGGNQPLYDLLFPEGMREPVAGDDK